MSRRRATAASVVLAVVAGECSAFTAVPRRPAAPTATAPPAGSARTSATARSASIDTPAESVGNLHGQGSCFMPLLQNDEEYIAPRIVQIAGSYPGVDVATYLSLSSEPPADMGQWSYDFSDPEGPQLGTVALPGLASVYDTDDPVVLIADHQSLGVPLPDAITEPVDLIVLCDRSRTEFEDRRFLVMELEDRPGAVTIGAFETFDGLPAGARILGQVTLVQIPWLPVMMKKRSGFSEEEDLF